MFLNNNNKEKQHSVFVIRHQLLTVIVRVTGSLHFIVHHLLSRWQRNTIADVERENNCIIPQGEKLLGLKMNI